MCAEEWPATAAREKQAPPRPANSAAEPPQTQRQRSERGDVAWHPCYAAPRADSTRRRARRGRADRWRRIAETARWPRRPAGAYHLPPRGPRLPLPRELKFLSLSPGPAVETLRPPRSIAINATWDEWKIGGPTA